MPPVHIDRPESSPVRTKPRHAAPPAADTSLTYTAPRRRSVWRWIALGAVLLLLAEGLLFGAWWLLIRRETPAASVTERREPSHIPSFPEGMFCILDSDLGLVWTPIVENVPRETYNSANFTEKNGLKYYEDANVRTVAGVDVSEFQGEVDFKAIADAGVEFVMIRVGWRGYVTGELGEDETFAANIKGARDAGLLVGVYFFSQATTPEEAAEEAAFVLERIADYDIAFPVVFDWEAVHDPEARTRDMSGDQITDCAVAFCEAVQQAGYRPCVYFYKSLAYYEYDLSRLANYEFWLSEPYDIPDFYYRFSMWQYDVEGELPGVDETIDLNLCFVPVETAKPLEVPAESTDSMN